MLPPSTSCPRSWTRQCSFSDCSSPTPSERASPCGRMVPGVRSTLPSRVRDECLNTRPGPNTPNGHQTVRHPTQTRRPPGSAPSVPAFGLVHYCFVIGSRRLSRSAFQHSRRPAKVRGRSTGAGLEDEVQGLSPRHHVQPDLLYLPAGTSKVAATLTGSRHPLVRAGVGPVRVELTLSRT